jgi:hypothetical protein
MCVNTVTIPYVNCVMSSRPEIAAEKNGGKNVHVFFSRVNEYYSNSKWIWAL